MELHVQELYSGEIPLREEMGRRCVKLGEPSDSQASLERKGRWEPPRLLNSLREVWQGSQGALALRLAIRGYTCVPGSGLPQSP